MIEVLGYVASILMGLSLGLIGGGGSILSVPILYYLFKMDAIAATSDSLFIVGVTALVGSLINSRRGNVDLRTAIAFAFPSFAGVYFSRGIVLPFLPERLFSIFNFEMTKAILIMIGFALLMIAASRAMIRSGSVAQQGKEITVAPLLGIALKGFGVGAMTGFVGAGGGFLIVPALTLFLNLSMRRAIGTSLTIIAANSFFGFLVSLQSLSHEVNWRLLLTISGLGVLGILSGHALASKIADHQLKKAFGYFVLGVGSLVLIDQIIRAL